MAHPKHEAHEGGAAQRNIEEAAGIRSARFGVKALGIATEALASLRGRSVRSWMTAIGIALGIAAMVATVALSSTSAAAISERFNATEATQVTVSFSNSLRDEGKAPNFEDTERVRDLNGVADAGMECSSDDEAVLSRTAERYYTRTAPLHGVEPGALDAYGFTFIEGGPFDEGHVHRGDAVALIDTVVARELGYHSLDGGPIIYVDGTPYVVMGIFEAPTGEAQYTGSVITGPQPCTEADPAYSPAQVFIRTDLGAADKVAEEAPIAIFPEAPDELSVAKPSDLRNFRQGVESEMQALLLGLAAVSLVIGAVSVSNTALVSIMERRSEIGLRRAVGAARRAVAMQFVWEAALIGLAGGLIGTVLGVDVVALVSLLRDWRIVFDPVLLVAGPALGAVVGIVAGTYPAWRASRIPPAVTLRT